MINVHVAFVQSNLGCGTLGYLWLILEPEVYVTLSDIELYVSRSPEA